MELDLLLFSIKIRILRHQYIEEHILFLCNELKNSFGKEIREKISDDHDLIMKDLEIIESESFFNCLTSLAKLTLFLYQHMEYEELSFFPILQELSSKSIRDYL